MQKVAGNTLTSMAGGTAGALTPCQAGRGRSCLCSAAPACALTAWALKCFTKAAVAAPALALQGKKEEEEEGDREVNSTVLEAGSSMQARALMEAAPGPEGSS